MQIPTHSQMTLPLLEVLHQNGGMKAKDAAQAVAEKMALGSEITEATTELKNGRIVDVYGRRVRWLRQTLVGEGIISGERFNWWELTEAGRAALVNARPGVIITVFESESGVALWAEAETAVAYVRDESVQLILSSPPYPLTKSKQYGNRVGSEYLDWLTGLAASWMPKLKQNGSLVLNLQDVYESGEPVFSLYQERLLLRLADELGYKLCQKFVWTKPCPMPSSDWVTIKRVRVTNGFESFYWLGRSSNPKASNRRVLRPYGASMLRTLAQGGDQRTERPSGHGHVNTPSFAVDNGGSIPTNVFTSSSTAISNSLYHRGCREDGLPIHPARFPEEPVEFLIKLLTEENDTVWDPFGGSLTTGAIAERLNRNWISNEKSLAYLYGGRHRFDSASSRWAGPNPLELQRAMAGC